MELRHLLLENYQIFKAHALMKSNPEVNKSEIINKIRAVPYVIIVRTKEDPRLTYRNTENFEYTLMSIKFLSIMGKPSDTLKRIKNIVLDGNQDIHNIKGVIQFRPLFNTIKKVKKSW
jgi:hypothetical protein